MYFKTTVKAGKTIEVTKSYTKRVGTTKRSGRKQLTPEEMDKINELNAARKLRLKINANFKKGDPYITLTYRKDCRPNADEVKKNILKPFFDKLRAYYKKQGTTLKYIIVTEYENKAIHHHLIVNDVDNIEKVINNLWVYGRPNYKYLDGTGQYKDLANYLIKETSKTYRKNKLEGKGAKQRYSCSKNLIIPQSVTEVVKASRWLADPKPIKGYYVDQDTIFNGIDPFTGREYQKYTLVEIGECYYNPFEQTG